MPNITSFNNHYFVSGTSGNDKITVTQDQNNYKIDVNGKTSEIPIAEVEALTISGGAGDDTIDLSAVKQSSADIYIFGGFGEDDITGSQGDDHIDGGRSSDKIDGGDGDDIIQGGHDVDSIVGGRGDDKIWGDYRVNYNAGDLALRMGVGFAVGHTMGAVNAISTILVVPDYIDAAEGNDVVNPGIKEDGGDQVNRLLSNSVSYYRNFSADSITNGQEFEDYEHFVKAANQQVLEHDTQRVVQMFNQLFQ